MRYVRLSYAAMIIVAVYLAAYGTLWRGTSPYPIALFVMAAGVFCIPVALLAIMVEAIAYFRCRTKK